MANDWDPVLLCAHHQTRQPWVSASVSLGRLSAWDILEPRKQRSPSWPSPFYKSETGQCCGTRTGRSQKSPPATPLLRTPRKCWTRTLALGRGSLSESLVAHWLGGLRAARISMKMVSDIVSLGHPTKANRNVLWRNCFKFSDMSQGRRAAYSSKIWREIGPKLRNSRESSDIPKTSLLQGHIHHVTAKLSMPKDRNDKYVFMDEKTLKSPKQISKESNRHHRWIILLQVEQTEKSTDIQRKMRCIYNLLWIS